MKDVKYINCSKCGSMPDEAIAKRLRRVCNALDLKDCVPDDDLELYGCMFSVLGIIARTLEIKNKENESKVHPVEKYASNMWRCMKSLTVQHFVDEATKPLHDEIQQLRKQVAELELNDEKLLVVREEAKKWFNSKRPFYIWNENIWFAWQACDELNKARIAELELVKNEEIAELELENKTLREALHLSRNVINGEYDKGAIFGNEQDISKYLQKLKVLEKEVVNKIDEALSTPTSTDANHQGQQQGQSSAGSGADC